MNKNRSNKRWMAQAVILLICGCMTSCGNTGEKDQRENAGSKNSGVISTIAVSEGFLKDELVLNGDVTCDESKVSKVFIPCSGKIQNVRIEAGDYVRQGQLLASVFSQDAAGYEKQLSDINSEIRVARRELSMKQDMHKSGMASDKEVEEARSRMDMALAEKNRLQYVASVNGFSSKSNATITSPISGYVLSKNIYNGSYIDDTNNDIPAFEIADLSKVWIVADVYESDIRMISQGEHVYAKVPAYPDKKFSGQIDKIYRCLDSESKTMKVRICLDNGNGWLMPGMFANVYVLLTDSGRKMMQVPSSCIVFENGNNYVVIADKNGKYHRQIVEVAHQDETTAYLESGVKIGDRVVNKNTLLEYNNLK